MKYDVATGDTFYVVSGLRFHRRANEKEYTEIHVVREDTRFFYTEEGRINKRSGRFKFDNLRGTEELYTYDEIAKDVWVLENNWKIAECMKRVKDYDTLRQIAGLAGYPVVAAEPCIKGA